MGRLYRAIAQGCSEYNITVMVDQKDSVKALRAVHARFYLATLPLALGIVGPGLIGGTFLAQLRDQLEVPSPVVVMRCVLCCARVSLSLHVSPGFLWSLQVHCKPLHEFVCSIGCQWLQAAPGVVGGVVARSAVSDTLSVPRCG